MNPIHNLYAHEIVDLLLSKKLFLSDVIEGFIKHIKMVERSTKAWESIDFDRIRKYTSEMAFLEKRNRSLYGVPIGLKDIFNTTDLPNRMGSKAWKNHFPGNDARILQNIMSDGAIIFGKTVTAEFAVHHLPSDKTVNPIDSRFIVGTSSSGSAAAVATKMVPVSIGSQTGGSIIRPASYCGIYGFKPTFGVIPRTGSLKTTDSLDTIGLFANCIQDLRIVFESMRVKGFDYPYAAYQFSKNSKFFEKKSNYIVGSFNENYYVFKKYQKYALGDYSKTINFLANNNRFKIKKFDFPSEWNDISNIHKIIYDTSLSYYFRNEQIENDKDLSPQIKEIILRGKNTSENQYRELLKLQAMMSIQANNLFKEFDFVLTLSTAGEPPRIGEAETDDTALIWTFLGLPSISLPIYIGPNKMPFGLQIISRRYNDYALLQFSSELISTLKT